MDLDIIADAYEELHALSEDHWAADAEPALLTGDCAMPLEERNNLGW